MADIFNAFDSKSEPIYTRVLAEGEEENIMYCLIYIPSFSEHEITIYYTIKEFVETVGGPIALALYGIICIVGSATFIYPVFAGTIRIGKRRR